MPWYLVLQNVCMCVHVLHRWCDKLHDSDVLVTTPELLLHCLAHAALKVGGEGWASRCLTRTCLLLSFQPCVITVLVPWCLWLSHIYKFHPPLVHQPSRITALCLVYFAHPACTSTAAIAAVAAIAAMTAIAAIAATAATAAILVADVHHWHPCLR